MDRFFELIDRLKHERKLNSDNQVAKLLGFTRQALCDYRKRRRHPDDYALTRLALELGIDPLTLIAEVRAETDKGERRKFWRDFFRRVRPRALILPLICGVFLLAGSGNGTSYANPLNINHHYTK